ncbi:MAG: hypothetical protein LBR78_01065 [Holosporales bacterium]|nr:hypothetical protein [Holosporales bacterium]
MRFGIHTILQYVKRHLLAICVAAMAMLVHCLTTVYRDSGAVELESIKDVSLTAADLVVNPQKLRFMTEHSFSGSGEGFESFVHKLADDTIAKIGAIQMLEESKVGLLNVQKLSITCTFWHETFIFEFLKKLQEFKPGFARIAFVDITRFATISAENPALKLQVTCQLYRK